MGLDVTILVGWRSKPTLLNRLEEPKISAELRFLSAAAGNSTKNAALIVTWRDSSVMHLVTRHMCSGAAAALKSVQFTIHDAWDCGKHI